MGATLFDCYICKVQGTSGVCADCLVSLPDTNNIKRETCDCDSIEEVCSCLDADCHSHFGATTSNQEEYQAEYVENPSNCGELILKISSTKATEWITAEWLLQFIQYWCDQYTKY